MQKFVDYIRLGIGLYIGYNLAQVCDEAVNAGYRILKNKIKNKKDKKA